VWTSFTPSPAPTERARRLEEYAGLVDLLHEIAVVDALVRERFLEVLLVVHRRGDDLSGIRHRAEQLHLRNRLALAFRDEVLLQLGQGGDQRIVPRKGIVSRRGASSARR
jgi:hypothetical protein